MLRPDYQYSLRLVTAMASMIASGHYDVVLDSQIFSGGALVGECRSTSMVLSASCAFRRSCPLPPPVTCWVCPLFRQPDTWGALWLLCQPCWDHRSLRQEPVKRSARRS